MSKTTYRVDPKQLKDFQKFLKKAPVKLFKAQVNLINSLAFGLRKRIFTEIKGTMTIRNPGFLSRSVRVKKASKGSPISIVGSVERRGFSGWKEQEKGSAPIKKRVATNFARGGTWRGKIRPGLRVKPGKKYRNPNDISGGNKHSRAVATMSRGLRSRAKPFVIYGHNKLPPGLYKRKGKNLMLAQRFASSAKPKLNRWMTKSKRTFISRGGVRVAWKESARRSLLT